MDRNMARRPISKRETYLKYGFVATEHEKQSCPQCGSVLNAGPGHQPKYCERCGQRITFDGVAWMEEKTLGYVANGSWKERD